MSFNSAIVTPTSPKRFLGTVSGSLLLGWLFALSFAVPALGTIASCRSDGAADALPCLRLTLNTAQSRGDAQVFLPNGTYLLSSTLVIPNKVQLIGNGRGDQNLIGTVLLAAPNFPSAAPVVQMGPTPGPNFGIHVENLTINCAGRAASGLLNTSSEELTQGKDLLIAGCTRAGLDIETYAAQNSGPFENIEIYPHSVGISPSTVCVRLHGLIGFRGVKNITCNFDPGTSAQVGMQSDGGGYFEFLHIEQAVVGLQLGTSSISADAVTVINAQFGPNVNTGVLITAPSGNTQNLALFALSCVGCTHLLNDTETGNIINDNSIGWYALGNGAGSTKTVLCSNYGVAQKIYADLGAFNLSAGQGNNIPATLSIWNSTPNGATSTIEQASAGQGSTNLSEWRSEWGQTLAAVDSTGMFHVPSLQLGIASIPGSCGESYRGTMQMLPSSVDGHDEFQVCARMTDGTYAWKTLLVQ